jgi:trimethylamine--corrinoid protein Co-methyltransferase
MILSLEQLLVDVEIFRRCQRLRRGIGSQPEAWLDEVIERVGPGGNFLSQPSTRDAARHGEWYLSKIGWRGAYEHWEQAGKPSLLAELHQEVANRLDAHQPTPFDTDTQRELDRLIHRARQEDWRP